MFSVENSVLIVIDIQGKLAKLMHAQDILFTQVSKLIRTAYLLDIPILVTEQVPQKIGRTVPEIADHLNEYHPIEKNTFSCCGEKQFNEDLKKTGRKQVIITGIEAHVCVYQTVCDLQDQKYSLQVVGDAVSSRSVDDKYFGLDRIKNMGIRLSSTEMIICELLKTAEHPKFKEVINVIK